MVLLVSDSLDILFLEVGHVTSTCLSTYDVTISCRDMSYKLNNLPYVLLINSGGVAFILIAVHCRCIKEAILYYLKIVLSWFNSDVVMEIDYAGILLAEYLNGYVILSKNENCRV
jgi:hypothetical protein